MQSVHSVIISPYSFSSFHSKLIVTIYKIYAILPIQYNDMVQLHDKYRNPSLLITKRNKDKRYK